MRIAYVNADPGVPAFGNKGCSIHVQEMLRSFLKLGHIVELFSPKMGGTPSRDLQRIKINRLKNIPKCNVELRERIAIETSKEIYNALINGERFDLVYERYSLWNYSGIQYAKELNIPFVLEVNSPLIYEQEKYRQIVNKDYASLLSKYLFESASVIVAVSKSVKDYVIGLCPNVIHKIKIIHNGVNLEKFDQNAPPVIRDNSNSFIMGFLGSLKPWHGIIDLVRIFSLVHSKYSNSKLLIVGDGVERDNLNREIYKYTLQNEVILTGLVNHDVVPGYLSSMDIAIAPYPLNINCYFSPLKIFEYMSSGLPVVASSVGQINELIMHGVNGFLCEPGNYAEFVKYVSLLKEDPVLRKNMGISARKSVVNNGWINIADKVISCTREINFGSNRLEGETGICHQRSL